MRKEHYLKLDQEFIKPLSKSIFLRQSSTVTNEMNSLKIEFIPLEEKSLRKGINHLKVDSPECYAEYESLPGSVNKFNSELEGFYNDLDSEIRREFTGILETNDKYDYQKDGMFIISVKQVKEVILILFFRFLANVTIYDKKLIEEICKSAIISDIDKCATVCFIGKKPFQIFGISVTNFPYELSINLAKPNEGMSHHFIELEKNNEIKKFLIIEHISKIVLNEPIFEKFSHIRNNREHLLETETTISRKFKQLSDSINKGDYETKAECCVDEKLW
jgi:hypothetical protein